jgi:hypothetical protein
MALTIGYGITGQDSIHGTVKRLSSSSQRLDQPWNPQWAVAFPTRTYSDQTVNITTQIQLLPITKNYGAILPLPPHAFKAQCLIH